LNFQKKIKGGKYMWVRFLMIGLFSLTASSFLFYQGIEISHAFLDYFKKNSL
jgi:hypothetical protein